MSHKPTRTAEERALLISCTADWTALAAESGDSQTLDAALAAYGPLEAPEICQLVKEYIGAHDAELRDLIDRHRDDPRRPALLADVALPFILERLEHDRHALRQSWIGTHDARQLRRIADLWAVRLGS